MGEEEGLNLEAELQENNARQAGSGQPADGVECAAGEPPGEGGRGGSLGAEQTWPTGRLVYRKAGRCGRHTAGVQCAWGKVSLTAVQPSIKYSCVGLCVLNTNVSGPVYCRCYLTRSSPKPLGLGLILLPFQD